MSSSEALVLANSVTSDTVGVVLFAIRVAARTDLRRFLTCLSCLVKNAKGLVARYSQEGEDKEMI